MFIGNAFSLQMIQGGSADIRVRPISLEKVKKIADLESAIGHVDTANVVSTELGRQLPAQRVNISLQSGDSLIVAQLVGGRLPEGATTLPENFKIVYLRVDIL